MKRHFPHLCSPITIGRVTFRNRMFSAPMGGTDITNDGCIGPKSTAFYELREKAALVRLPSVNVWCTLRPMVRTLTPGYFYPEFSGSSHLYS